MSWFNRKISCEIDWDYRGWHFCRPEIKNSKSDLLIKTMVFNICKILPFNQIDMIITNKNELLFTGGHQTLLSVSFHKLTLHLIICGSTLPEKLNH